MMIRLVLGFAALFYLAIIQPGSAQSGRLEEQLAQSTPITPTVLAVVRNQGATLYDRRASAEHCGRFASHGSPAFD